MCWQYASQHLLHMPSTYMGTLLGHEEDRWSLHQIGDSRVMFSYVQSCCGTCAVARCRERLFTMLDRKGQYNCGTLDLAAWS